MAHVYSEGRSYGEIFVKSMCQKFSAAVCKFFMAVQMSVCEEGVSGIWYFDQLTIHL